MRSEQNNEERRRKNESCGDAKSIESRSVLIKKGKKRGMHSEPEQEGNDNNECRDPFRFSIEINRSISRKRESCDTKKERRFPQITTSPIVCWTAKKTRRNQGDKIFGRKRTLRGKFE